jgi:PilZ domain-containing protein
MDVMAEVLDAQAVPEKASDKRSGRRFELGRPASLSMVGTPGRVLSGEIRNVSEGGTQVRLAERVEPSTLVRIEYDDNLLLGEVVYCRPDQSSWLAGIKVEHGLFGLAGLAEAMKGF